MTVGEDLPFDLIWQMTKDDILGAVREICPRGFPQSEETIQMGTAKNSSTLRFYRTNKGKKKTEKDKDRKRK